MRLLRKILLYDGTGTHAANNAFRLTVSGAPTVVTLAATATGQEYYLSADGAASPRDLIDEINDELMGEGIAVALNIVGVDIAADSARASGRIQFLNPGPLGADCILTTGHASWTLPSGVMGYPSGVGVGTDITLTLGATGYSPSIHRYGWYPQQYPNLGGVGNETRRSWSEFVPIRGSVDEDGLTWGSYAVRRFEWFEGVVAAPYLTAEAAADATWQAAYGLSTGTQFGTWEQFCEDLRDAETAGERDWRYYPDASDEDTYKGPYRLRPESLLADPMAAWALPTPAGGCYAGAFEGHRDL